LLKLFWNHFEVHVQKIDMAAYLERAGKLICRVSLLVLRTLVLFVLVKCTVHGITDLCLQVEISKVPVSVISKDAEYF
jgi:hypothetical protein